MLEILLAAMIGFALLTGIHLVRRAAGPTNQPRRSAPAGGSDPLARLYRATEEKTVRTERCPACHAHNDPSYDYCRACATSLDE